MRLYVCHYLTDCAVGRSISIRISPKDRYVVPNVACVDHNKTGSTFSVERHLLSKEDYERKGGADENRQYHHVARVLGLHHLDLMLISCLHSSHCSDWNDNDQANELTTHDWCQTKFELIVLYSDDHVYKLQVIWAPNHERKTHNEVA